MIAIPLFVTLCAGVLSWVIHIGLLHSREVHCWALSLEITSCCLALFAAGVSTSNFKVTLAHLGRLPKSWSSCTCGCTPAASKSLLICTSMYSFLSPSFHPPITMRYKGTWWGPGGGVVWEDFGLALGLHSFCTSTSCSWSWSRRCLILPCSSSIAATWFSNLSPISLKVTSVWSALALMVWSPSLKGSREEATAELTQLWIRSQNESSTRVMEVEEFGAPLPLNLFGLPSSVATRASWPWGCDSSPSNSIIARKWRGLNKP